MMADRKDVIVETDWINTIDFEAITGNAKIVPRPAVGEPVRFTPRQELWAREGSAEKWLEERSAYYFAESLLQDVRLEEVRDPPEACIHAVGREGGVAFCPDAYTFEVCYYNQVCTNRDELFAVETGADFLCEFDAARYRELKGLLE